MARETPLDGEKQVKADQIFMSATIQTSTDGIFYGVGFQGVRSQVGFIYGTIKTTVVTIPTYFNSEEWVLLEANKRQSGQGEAVRVGKMELAAELAKFGLTIEEVAGHYYQRALTASR